MPKKLTGADFDDVDDIVNQGLLLPSTEAVVFVRPSILPGDSKVSLRGKGSVDLCRVAVALGGGGHKNAAGCTLHGDVESVAFRLTKAVTAALPKK